MTEFIQGDIQVLLESVPKMTSLFTAYEYDEKDRQIKTILPDGSIQFAEFEIKAEKTFLTLPTRSATSPSMRPTAWETLSE